MKTLILRGEMILGLAPKLEPLCNERREISLDLMLQTVRQLIETRSEVESNVYIISQLLV